MCRFVKLYTTDGTLDQSREQEEELMTAVAPGVKEMMLSITFERSSVPEAFDPLSSIHFF